MKSGVTTCVLVCLLALALPAKEKKRNWIPASVTGVAKTKSLGQPGSFVMIGNDSNVPEMEYTIEADQHVYTVRVTSLVPSGWKGKVPVIAEAGEELQVSLNKKDGWIQDAGGKEHYFRIMSEALKPRDEAQAARVEPPTR